MIDFDDIFDEDAEEFRERVEKEQDLYEKAKHMWEDPVIKQTVKQFAKGVAVTVGVALVKHAVYRYLDYRDGFPVEDFELDNEEAVQ